MKYEYGKSSELKLSTVDPYIRHIFRKALALGLIDITIAHGHRGKTLQNELFYTDPQLSKTPWPESKHNQSPSEGSGQGPIATIIFEVRADLPVFPGLNPSNAITAPHK